MSLRVLLVEDDAPLANLLGQFLTRAGFCPVLCSTGADALAHWDDTCAVAVVDLGLPDIPGETLVAIMASQVPGIPIIVSSGMPFEPGFDEGSMGGALGRRYFLQKPYRPVELVELIIGIGAANPVPRING